MAKECGGNWKQRNENLSTSKYKLWVVQRSTCRRFVGPLLVCRNYDNEVIMIMTQHSAFIFSEKKNVLITTAKFTPQILRPAGFNTTFYVSAENETFFFYARFIFVHNCTWNMAATIFSPKSSSRNFIPIFSQFYWPVLLILLFQ